MEANLYTDASIQIFVKLFDSLRLDTGFIPETNLASKNIRKRWKTRVKDVNNLKKITGKGCLQLGADLR